MEWEGEPERSTSGSRQAAPLRPPTLHSALSLQNFWSRLAGRYGTKFYWVDNGQDVAIVNTVAAIDNCLREPVGRGQCNEIRGELE